MFCVIHDILLYCYYFLTLGRSSRWKEKINVNVKNDKTLIVNIWVVLLRKLWCNKTAL